MADEIIPLKVVVDGVEKEIKSLKDLKQARKDLTNEYIQGDEKAAASLAKLQDKLEDLQDAAKSVKGSGIESASSSFALLGDSVKNLDFDKFKTSLKGLKSALASTGILLLVQGVMYLIENFDELSKGSGLLAKALRVVGDILGGIKDAFLSVTDAIGLTNTALDEQGEAIAKNAEKFKEALAAQTAAYDRQIMVAKAAGENTVALEKAKQQAIIDTNVLIAKQIEAFVRAGGELDDEKRKLLSASLEAIKNAKAQERVIELNDYKQKQDNYKKHLDELAKIKSERDKRAAADFADALKAEDEYQQEFGRAVDEREKERLTQANEGRKLIAEQEKAARDQAVKEAQDSADKSKEEALANAQAIADGKVTIERGAFEAARGLSDLFFSSQLKGAEGNSKRQLEIQKKQFNVNKAFQIAQATIDGFRAVTTNIAAYPQPFGAIAGVLAGVIAAVNIAKIAGTKFDGGSASSGGAIDVSVPNIPAPPRLEPSGNAPPPPQGERAAAPLVAQVVETQITSTVNNVEQIKRQSVF